jgi:prepilin-type processing-associated H-X9-DG protein
MYCQKCGTEISDDARACIACGYQIGAPIQATPPGADAQQAGVIKTSGCAIASFILGILSLFLCFITALPAIICGIVALIKIGNSDARLKGTGLAITGMVLPIITVPIMLIVFLMPVLSKTSQIAERVVCSTNLKGLGTAIIVYANDYDDMPPTTDMWCDLLITKVDVSPKSFVCPDSDAVEGESSYAMNAALADRRLSDVDSNVVLLFETNKGVSEMGRDESIKKRFFYPYFEERPGTFYYHDPDLVFKDRFNQVGGPDILTMDNHKGEGCNILFADGHSAFVRSEEIPYLKWNPDE